MSGKKDPNKTFGKMLLSIGILNLIVRINTMADVALSFFFLARGGSVLKGRNWSHADKYDRFIAALGFIWSLFKLFWIYLFVSEKMIAASDGAVTKSYIMTSSAVFLFPAIVISILAYRKKQTPGREDV